MTIGSAKLYTIDPSVHIFIVNICIYIYIHYIYVCVRMMVGSLLLTEVEHSNELDDFNDTFSRSRRSRGER